MSILGGFILLFGFFAGCVAAAVHLANPFWEGVWTTLAFLSLMGVGYGIGEASRAT